MKTDLQLYQDIKEKLDFEPGVDHHNLTYSAHNGVVSVNGSVRSYVEKRLVKKVIAQLDGVKAIANNVQVNYGTALVPSDSEIAAAVVKALEFDLTLPSNKIKASVERGRIILTGAVHWQYQRQNAEKDIRYLPGVVAIDNLIEIKPELPMALAFQVKEKIAKEFERHALLDAQHISIEILGTTIVLKGTVQSWAELQDAAHIAWSIPGVIHVDNQIKIK